MWAKDNYRDYLNTNTAAPSSFMSGGANSSMLLDTMTGGSEAASRARTASAAVGDDEKLGAGESAEVVDGAVQTRGLQRILIDVHDDEDLGDDRIDPALLRQLLQERQDLAHLLYDCAIDAGLIQMEAQEDSKDRRSIDEPDEDAESESDN
jgi:hypothetical protein